jgi:hypothetical protein
MAAAMAREEQERGGGVSEQMYRLFNADGELLYVGISYSAIARFAQHRADKSWIDEVARIDIKQHDCSRAEVFELERQAIEQEKPKYNRTHVGARPRWRAAVSSPHDEFDHSWPASSPRLRNPYWVVRRNLPLLIEGMQAAGSTDRDIESLINELLHSTRFSEWHDNCPAFSVDSDAPPPIEYPYQRTAHGMCLYTCRACGLQWTVWRAA